MFWIRDAYQMDDLQTLCFSLWPFFIVSLNTQKTPGADKVQVDNFDLG